MNTLLHAVHAAAHAGIIVMSVMNGLRHELIARIVGFNGHVTIYGSAGPLADFDDVGRAVRGLPGVLSAVPVIDGQAMATANGAAAGARQPELRQMALAATGRPEQDQRRRRPFRPGVKPGHRIGIAGSDQEVGRAHRRAVAKIERQLDHQTGGAPVK